MKKIVALLLVMMFVACCPAVMAEAVEVESDSVVIDLTGIILALIGLVFNFLLAWLGKSVLPELREWLHARTTADQRAILWNVVVTSVEAAEQIVGAGKGRDKLQIVKTWLKNAGYRVDEAMIEAAVKEMNDKALDKLKEGLGVHAESEEPAE